MPKAKPAESTSALKPPKEPKAPKAPKVPKAPKSPKSNRLRMNMLGIELSGAEREAYARIHFGHDGPATRSEIHTRLRKLIDHDIEHTAKTHAELHEQTGEAPGSESVSTENPEEIS